MYIVEQIPAIGVSAECLEFPDLTAHPVFLAENPHPLLPLHQPPRQGVLDGVSDKHHDSLSVSNVVAQMMQHPPAFGHSRCRNDDMPVGDVVERF